MFATSRWGSGHLAELKQNLGPRLIAGQQQILPRGEQLEHFSYRQSQTEAGDMSDDLLLQYGRAAYQATKWTREAEMLLVKMEARESSGALEVYRSAIVESHQSEQVAGHSPAKRSASSREPLTLLRASLYRGVCARVSKRLNVSMSIVARVAKGKAISKRISEELKKEELQIELQFRAKRGTKR